MDKHLIPISERIASKLVAENNGNLTAYIVETVTVFKDYSGNEIFRLHKQQRDDGEVFSYSMYVDKYKQVG